MHVDEQTYDASATPGEELDFSNPVSHFRQIYATFEGYNQIGTKLYREQNPDLMAVYFEGTDSAMHLFIHCMPPKPEWTPQDEYARYMDVVTEMFKRADEVVGEFLKQRDEDTTVIIVSDHGFECGDERIQRKSGLELATAHLQHKLDGVVIMSGPPIRKNEEIFGSSVLDVAPTILYLLGLPVGRDMDGRVLDDAIARDYLAQNPPEFIDTYEGDGSGLEGEEGEPEEPDESVSNEMVARLEALGYLGGGKSGGVPAEIDGNMARIKKAKGKLAEAAEEYEKALAKRPEDAATHYDLAQVCVQLGQLVKAIEHAQTAVQLAPNNVPFKFGLAGIYEMQERYSASVEVYQTVLAASPGHADGLANLGNAYYRMEKAEEAKELFEKALQANPKHWNALFNLGVYHEQKGEHDRAVECYQGTIEIAPKNISAYVNMGNCYDKKGDVEEALRSYRGALALDRNHVPAHFNIGLINSRLGKHEEAAQNFSRAIDINPELAPLYREYFFTSVRLNESDKAAQALEAWLRLEPANPEVWFHKSRFQFAGDNRQEGFNFFTKCIQLGGEPFLQRGLKDPLLQRAANHIAASRVSPATGEVRSP
jgi:tetratricopeptide (TPR) repeat protein